MSSILLVKGQFYNETREGGLGFYEVHFITLQLDIQVVKIIEAVSNWFLQQECRNGKM